MHFILLFLIFFLLTKFQIIVIFNVVFIYHLLNCNYVKRAIPDHLLIFYFRSLNDCIAYLFLQNLDII